MDGQNQPPNLDVKEQNEERPIEYAGLFATSSQGAQHKRFYGELESTSRPSGRDKFPRGNDSENFTALDHSSLNGDTVINDQTKAVLAADLSVKPAVKSSPQIRPLRDEEATRPDVKESGGQNKPGPFLNYRSVGYGLSENLVYTVLTSEGVNSDIIETGVARTIAAGVEFKMRCLIQEAYKVACRKVTAACAKEPRLGKQDIDIACRILKINRIGRLGPGVAVKLHTAARASTTSEAGLLPRRFVPTREFAVQADVEASARHADGIQQSRLRPLYPSVKIHWMACGGAVPPTADNEILMPRTNLFKGKYVPSVKRLDSSGGLNSTVGNWNSVFQVGTCDDSLRPSFLSPTFLDADTSIDPTTTIEVCDRPPNHAGGFRLDKNEEPTSQLQDASNDAMSLLLIKKCENAFTKEQQLYLNRVRAVITAAIELPEHSLTDGSYLGDRTQLPSSVGGVEVTNTRSALERVLRSLANVTGLAPALPFFLAFVANKIKQQVRSGSFQSLSVLLRALVAIASNDKLSVIDYFNQILQSLFLLILSPFLGGKSYEAVQNSLLLRKAAAEALRNILRKFCRKHGVVQPSIRVVEMLSSLLRRQTVPLTTLIGAVLTLRAIGSGALDVALIPVIPVLLDALELPATNLISSRPEAGIFQSEEFISGVAEPSVEDVDRIAKMKIRAFLNDSLLDTILASISDVFAAAANVSAPEVKDVMMVDLSLTVAAPTVPDGELPAMEPERPGGLDAIRNRERLRVFLDQLPSRWRPLVMAHLRGLA